MVGPPEAVWLTVLLALLLALIASVRPAGISRIAWSHAVALHLLLTLRGG